jgi:peptidoglycan/LPS O-acetylase OafA/YrhL
MQPDSRAHRYEALDGLRGVAALTVMAGHCVVAVVLRAGTRNRCERHSPGLCLRALDRGLPKRISRLSYRSLN